MTSKRAMRDYVEAIAAETRQYLNALSQENAGLRGRISALEAEHAAAPGTSTLARELSSARRAAAEREGEIVRAEQQIRELREQLRAYDQKEQAFQEQLALLEERQVQSDGRHADLERRLAHMCSLHVASYRLHESLAREEVLSAVSEVIANSVGCELFAIFERADDPRTLELIGSVGLDAARFSKVELGDDPVSHSIQNGRLYLRGEGPVRGDGTAPSEGGEDSDAGPDWRRPLVAVPLILPDRSVIGAIVLFELLPQKPALERIDHELFELLGSQAALALLWSRKVSPIAA